jgi:hypothetical protein
MTAAIAKPEAPVSTRMRFVRSKWTSISASSGSLAHKYGVRTGNSKTKVDVRYSERSHGGGLWPFTVPLPVSYYGRPLAYVINDSGSMASCS